MLESPSFDSTYLPNFSFLGNCDACSLVYIAIDFYLLQRSTYKIDHNEQEPRIRQTYFIVFDGSPVCRELQKYGLAS